MAFFKICIAVSALIFAIAASPVPEYKSIYPDQQNLDNDNAQSYLSKSNENLVKSMTEQSDDDLSNTNKLVAVPVVLRLNSGEAVPVLLKEPVRGYVPPQGLPVSEEGVPQDDQKKGKELLQTASATYYYTPLYQFRTISGRRRRGNYYPVRRSGYYLSGFMEDRDRFPTVA